MQNFQNSILVRVEPNACMNIPNDIQREGIINIINICPRMVTFKTSAPNKYIVRPHTGIVRPDKPIKVMVKLRVEANVSDCGKDKFLVLVLPLKVATDAETLREFWADKNASMPNLERHRLVIRGRNYETKNAKEIANVKKLLQEEKRAESTQIKVPKKQGEGIDAERGQVGNEKFCGLKI